MKDVKRINSTVKVERNLRRLTTEIAVLVNGERTVLANLKTSDYFWLKYEKNDRYIVVYSRGCMANQIPLKVEAVYDIKNQKVVEVTKANKVIFEYMVLARKRFDLATVIEYINDSLLNIASAEETQDFHRYLTAGNEKITREQVKEYIMSCYPILMVHADYDYILTVMEYRALEESIGTPLAFHIMPEGLDK